MSSFNEVVMLLAMKKNQEAWDKISTMEVETAREYYILKIFIVYSCCIYHYLIFCSSGSKSIISPSTFATQEAWDKISTMEVETAREYYIKAIAANRLEKIGDAIMSIEFSALLAASQ